MPLGYERLNERTQRPNVYINFIKPWPRSSPEDQKIATDFLERIAAQCYPVMKQHHISVNALEEFPPNREFLGRNFNAGECVQLVLKDKAGRWLSFKFVQKVMMHELAHCKQMNHSRAFWKVRNQYSNEMDELWAKKYEGEGMWGRGQNLTSGAFVHDRMPDEADIPEHLCGGTYRSRGRKRKRGQDGAAAEKPKQKPQPTYAERQKKRVDKKFGIYGGGQRLGEDLLVRGALEQGHRGSGKPTVASSKRRKHLSATAALARLEASAKQQQIHEGIPDEEDNYDYDHDDYDDTHDDDDAEEDDDPDDPYADRMDIFNSLERIKDSKGRDMYKVCGDEGEQDEGGQEEKDELRIMGVNGLTPTAGRNATAENGTTSKSEENIHEDSETESEPEVTGPKAGSGCNVSNANGERESDMPHLVTQNRPIQSAKDSPGSHTLPNNPPTTTPVSGLVSCPICSLENESKSPTCMACSHVLKPSLIKSHWRCKSDQCKGTSYINAGDVGRCGLCGRRKPVATESKAMGFVDTRVLRWD